FLSASPAWQLTGALLFLAHSILDGCDGELARLKFLETRHGAVLDFWGDNIVHFAVFSGIAVGWALHVHSAWPLVVGAVAVAAAFVVIAAQTLGLVILAGELDGSGGSVLGRLAATQYFRAAVGRVLAAAVLLLGALAVRRAPRVGTWWPLLLGGVAALVVSAAWMSHAAARLDQRGVLLALEGLHQLAAAVWIGGLLHLVVTALGRTPVAEPAALMRRFSTLAL